MYIPEEIIVQTVEFTDITGADVEEPDLDPKRPTGTESAKSGNWTPSPSLSKKKSKAKK